MANIPEVKLAPDVIAQVGPFAVTNAHMATFFVTIVIIILALFIRRGAGVKPSKAQVAFELVRDFIYDKMILSFGSEKAAKRYLPLMLTIFIFLLLANQFSLIPFVESIVTKDGVALFRTPTSHYSLPIALTLGVIFLAHFMALAIHPIRHIGNFIKIGPLFKMKSIKELPMLLLDIFLGILDIVGEFAKIVSLSTRLFGNVLAGGIIIAIISGVTAYTQFVAPIPFLILSTLSGLVQAFVFTMLSIIFISSAVNGVQPQTTQPTQSN